MSHRGHAALCMCFGSSQNFWKTWLLAGCVIYTQWNPTFWIRTGIKLIQICIQERILAMGLIPTVNRICISSITAALRHDTHTVLIQYVHTDLILIWYWSDTDLILIQYVRTDLVLIWYWSDTVLIQYVHTDLILIWYCSDATVVLI